MPPTLKYLFSVAKTVMGRKHHDHGEGPVVVPRQQEGENGRGVDARK
jgi:hypothetical protein